MAGRLFIFTLGFHENFALRRLSTEGAGRGDVVEVFTTSPAASGVIRAYESLKQMASRFMEVEVLGLREVDLASGLPRASLTVLEHLEPLVASGRTRVIADLSGGSRGVGYAVHLALSLVRGLEVDVYLQSDTSDAWELHLPTTVSSLISARLPGDVEDMLITVLESEGATVDELARLTGLAAKTISNRLSRLQKMGLAVRRGRRRGVYLTEWGRLLAEAMRISRAVERGG